MFGYVWARTLSIVRRMKRPWLKEGVTIETSGCSRARSSEKIFAAGSSPR